MPRSGRETRTEDESTAHPIETPSVVPYAAVPDAVVPDESMQLVTICLN
jgi:hypothetical protein